MTKKTYNTIVIMPDNSKIEVHYYFKKQSGDKNKMALYIQLHDCISTINIEKSFSKNEELLERIVHNKVLNTKGHLCE